MPQGGCVSFYCPFPSLILGNAALPKVTRLAPVGNPRPYPKGGAFDAMLRWHLKEWGTHAGGNTTHNEGPWDLPTFAALVAPDAPSEESALKNVQNWIKENGAPKDEHRFLKILDELFGTKPCFDEWRNDLIDAWKARYTKPPTDSAPETPARPSASKDEPSMGMSGTDLEIDRVECKPVWTAGQGMTFRSVEFSPQGDKIATACEYKDGVWLWDAATGESVAKLCETSMSDGVAVFSPDGAHVLVLPTFYDLTLLHVDSAATMAKYRGRHARFSPDGNQVVIACHKEVRIWDNDAGGVIASLKGHQESVRTAAFSPNGRFIVSTSEDGTAIVWDTATDFIVHTLRGHQDCVSNAAFSPDSLQIVTTSHDKTARIWSTVTGEQIAKLEGHDRWTTDAAFSPDGRLVATASRDGYVRFWLPSTGRCVGVIRDANPNFDVAFSPCGSRVATASKTGLRCFSLTIHTR